MFPDMRCGGGVEKPLSVEHGADAARCLFLFMGAIGDQFFGELGEVGVEVVGHCA